MILSALLFFAPLSIAQEPELSDFCSDDPIRMQRAGDRLVAIGADVVPQLIELLVDADERYPLILPPARREPDFNFEGAGMGGRRPHPLERHLPTALPYNFFVFDEPAVGLTTNQIDALRSWHTEKCVAARAALALGSIRPTSPTILSALDGALDAQAPIADQAAWSLASIGAPAREVLIARILSTRDRSRAAWALSRFETPPTAVLLELMHEEPKYEQRSFVADWMRLRPSEDPAFARHIFDLLISEPREQDGPLLEISAAISTLSLPIWIEQFRTNEQRDTRRYAFDLLDRYVRDAPSEAREAIVPELLEELWPDLLQLLSYAAVNDRARGMRLLSRCRLTPEQNSAVVNGLLEHEASASKFERWDRIYYMGSFGDGSHLAIERLLEILEETQSRGWSGATDRNSLAAAHALNKIADLPESARARIDALLVDAPPGWIQNDLRAAHSRGIKKAEVANDTGPEESDAEEELERQINHFLDGNEYVRRNVVAQWIQEPSAEISSRMALFLEQMREELSASSSLTETREISEARTSSWQCAELRTAIQSIDDLPLDAPSEIDEQTDFEDIIPFVLAHQGEHARSAIAELIRASDSTREGARQCIATLRQLDWKSQTGWPALCCLVEHPVLLCELILEEPLPTPSDLKILVAASSPQLRSCAFQALAQSGEPIEEHATRLVAHVLDSRTELDATLHPWVRNLDAPTCARWSASLLAALADPSSEAQRSIASLLEAAPFEDEVLHAAKLSLQHLMESDEEDVANRAWHARVILERDPSAQAELCLDQLQSDGAQASLALALLSQLRGYSDTQAEAVAKHLALSGIAAPAELATGLLHANACGTTRWFQLAGVPEMARDAFDLDQMHVIERLAATDNEGLRRKLSTSTEAPLRVVAWRAMLLADTEPAEVLAQIEAANQERHAEHARLLVAEIRGRAGDLSAMRELDAYARDPNRSDFERQCAILALRDGAANPERPRSALMRLANLAFELDSAELRWLAMDALARHASAIPNRQEIWDALEEECSEPLLLRRIRAAEAGR